MLESQNDEIQMQKVISSPEKDQVDSAESGISGRQEDNFEFEKFPDAFEKTTDGDKLFDTFFNWLNENYYPQPDLRLDRFLQSASGMSAFSNNGYTYPMTPVNGSAVSGQLVHHDALLINKNLEDSSTKRLHYGISESVGLRRVGVGESGDIVLSSKIAASSKAGSKSRDDESDNINDTKADERGVFAEKDIAANEQIALISDDKLLYSIKPDVCASPCVQIFLSEADCLRNQRDYTNLTRAMVLAIFLY